MKEKIAVILKLLEEGHSVNEIQEMMALDYREFNKLLKAIRDAGYDYSRTFSSNGSIILKLNRGLNFNGKKTMRINVEDRIFKAIFISDLHIGGAFDNPALLRIVYDYAKKHNCNIIFNGGDLIDNIYPTLPYPPKNKTVASQVRKVLRVYPFDKSITNFVLYGNHDYKSLSEDGFDVARYLEERRYDLVSLGYGLCIIHLKDDCIAITHDLKSGSKIEIPDYVTIAYRGHSHKSKTRNNKLVYIPSLSNNVGSYEFKPLADFLDVEFTFFDKKIARINTKQLAIVRNEIRLANEEVTVVNPEYEELQQEKQRSHKQKKLTKKKNN